MVVTARRSAEHPEPDKQHADQAQSNKGREYQQPSEIEVEASNLEPKKFSHLIVNWIAKFKGCYRVVIFHRNDFQLPVIAALKPRFAPLDNSNSLPLPIVLPRAFETFSNF